MQPSALAGGELTPAHSDYINAAVHAIMQKLGGDAALVEAIASDDIAPDKLARVGKQFVVVEQFADVATNRPHAFAVYKIGAIAADTVDLLAEPAERFKLDSKSVFCVLADQRPKGWHVQLMQGTAGWWEEFMAATHTALVQQPEDESDTEEEFFGLPD